MARGLLGWVVMRFSMPARSRLPTVLALLASACIGEIGRSSADGPGEAVAGKRVDSVGDLAIADRCTTTYAPGHVPIHRLTNTEYSNTVRDLLFVDARPGDTFTPSAAGLSGFANDSDSLPVSEEQIAGYYGAAEAVAKQVVASKGTSGGAYEKLVTCAPSEPCATATIASLGARAFRRPLKDGEAKALLVVWNGQTSFDVSLADLIVALLMSPKFIFVHTTDVQSNVGGAVYPLDGWGIASRLSYALWQTMPDAQLFDLARAGMLVEPEVVRAQAVRMLKDARVDAMLGSLRNDWAGLGGMAEASGNVPGLEDGLRRSMVGEVDAFLHDVVARDKSFLTVLTGTSSFANKDLAGYYELPFAGTDPAAFLDAKLPANRRGLVTSAALLTNTAGDANFTHPVHRGKWVASKVLCDEVPPPPENVPELSFDTTQGEGQSPRQRLQQHVANPMCVGCHKTMDAVGLGLENYDPFGKWREGYPNAGRVDASGVLPDGTRFTTPGEMLEGMAKGEQARSCLARQLLGYVLTRALTSNDDLCVSKAIGALSVTETSTFSDLVAKIVGSRQFFMQTGEAR